MLIDRNVHTLIVDVGRAAPLSVTGYAVPDLAKADELFDVHMDQVFTILPLVALHWKFVFESVHPPETMVVAHPCHGGLGRGYQPGNVP